LASVGFRRMGPEELTEARAVGLSGDYARALAAAGIPPDIDDYVQLRAVGVPASFVQSLRRSGYVVRDADKLVEMWAVGVRADDLRAAPPRPPKPPHPPSNRRSDPDPDDDGGG
jgi:bla regulator protein BlaR1